MRGIPSHHSSYLLALLGIANTLGRIILGFISDKPWINRLMVYNLCLTICGIGEYFLIFNFFSPPRSTILHEFLNLYCNMINKCASSGYFKTTTYVSGARKFMF